MHLLLNREEIAEHLARKMLARRLKNIPIVWTTANQYIEKILKKYHKSKLLEINFTQVNELLLEDLKTHKEAVVIVYKAQFRKLVRWLVDNFDFSLLTEQDINDIVINNPNKSFTKTIGPQLTDAPVWIADASKIDIQQPILIRNIIHNEALIKSKMAAKAPFWFIDSGYTNFLHAKGKPWHRLVLDHIHHKPKDRYFPTDRLSLLPSFPMPWRGSGGKILVVESSPSHYQLFSKNIQDWRKEITFALRNQSDYAIEFREKNLNRKTRDNLYDMLKNEEYHCVITDSSAAAIEAIWCGIPVITLNQHITNSVARSSLADIDNLYRGPIGNWLCELTYSQFTLEEMYNGTALRIIRDYHHV